jgi:hypothetical protein
VIREVKEETGIDSSFHRLVAILEGHRGSGPTRENSSDLYCVCVLKATDESQPITIQETELERSDWIPIDEALSHHPMLSPSNAFGQMYRTALSIALHTNEPEAGPPPVALGAGLFPSVFPLGMGKRQATVWQALTPQKSDSALD